MYRDTDITNRIDSSRRGLTGANVYIILPVKDWTEPVADGGATPR